MQSSGTPSSGKPKFKSRFGKDGFTIPENVKLQGDKLFVSSVGWVTLRGSNPYPEGEAKQAIVTFERDKWYVTITYGVEVAEVPDNSLAIGVDMNAGQVACSTGDILPIRDECLKRLHRRAKRYQRMMARRQKGSNRRAKARHLFGKTCHAIKCHRKNRHHQISCMLANTAGTVCIEALKTRQMTKSAKGTQEKPGKNVKAKSGLNRVILGTGWGQLGKMLDYKVANVVRVNPRNTSITCHECGHVEKASRQTQAKFKCVQCGHENNADVNAALNILALGTGAAGRGGVPALAAVGTPKNHQIDMEMAA